MQMLMDGYRADYDKNFAEIIEIHIANYHNRCMCCRCMNVCGVCVLHMFMQNVWRVYQ